ncbi:MAG TPA: UbiD family decarboxylase [Desulfobacteraceae bacterium]|nr:UbiD family decarboxylase [Desulfobacteraceae bacterium]HPJ67891.1 UbiD family decarboxylase [Desulfobacteraceae bacterium]HPQ28773.1 UbiD family decarboxylase [Desulfobacteraceae bacterium]
MGTEYEDLREWIQKAQSMGEIKTTKAIELEDVGRISELSTNFESAPAIILDEFPGYKPGHRILINPYGSTRRMCLSFGFQTDLDRIELLEGFKKRVTDVPLLPPEVVDTGPILENCLEGNDVDLHRFPVPKWHLGDAGPYIGTGCLVITRDRDEGWVNLAPYRNQLHDKQTVGFYVSRGHHGWAHRDKYFNRGEPCPVAVTFGCDPLLFSAGMTELPWGVCEYDWAGGWREKPIKVVKGPVTGLPIPAHAEIVIEGFSYPGKTKMEGPFGEWTGYYASDRREEPFIEVQAVYFRNDPILLAMPPQKPPYDADKGRQYIKSAQLYNYLTQLGIPGISNAWCYGLGGCRLLVAVAINQQYCGHSRQVGHAAYATPIANYAGRYVVVVDDDIDVTDINDVMWALLTRSDPATSIDIVERATSTPLDPRMSPEDKTAGLFFNSRAIIDATKPFEWKDQFPMVVRPDSEYRRESMKKYGHLFDF